MVQHHVKILEFPKLAFLFQVVFLMENCVTSADAYPLSFQLFVDKGDGSYEAVTEKKSEPSITGIGKPKLDSSDTRTYLMNVRSNSNFFVTF